MDLSGTFDTTNALAGMFLWLLFGFLTIMINCDIQRFIRTHPLFFHLIGLLAFFFLFTLLDSNNNTTIVKIWVKTVFVYIMFLFLIKSKWYFILPILGLLLIDQSLKKEIAYRERKNQNVDTYKKIIKPLNVIIIIHISIGMLHYMYLQKIEYKNKFSLDEFFFNINKCKQRMPNYYKI